MEFYCSNVIPMRAFVSLFILKSVWNPEDIFCFLLPSRVGNFTITLDWAVLFIPVYAILIATTTYLPTYFVRKLQLFSMLLVASFFVPRHKTQLPELPPPWKLFVSISTMTLPNYGHRIGMDCWDTRASIIKIIESTLIHPSYNSKARHHHDDSRS